MASEFARATAVVRRGETEYSASIEPGWDFAGNANGGYLVALAARAMADAVGRPPLAVTAHFLRPGAPGECTIDVAALRIGRRTATARATLRADAGDVLAVLGTFGEQRPGGPAAVTGAPPDLPPLSETPPVNSAPGCIGDRVDLRVRPHDMGFRAGAPSGRAELAGWFRFADTDPVVTPIDVYGLFVALDAFAPVCFSTGIVPVSWAPTIELTVHIRGVPTPGPLRCRFTSRFLADGMFEEDGEVWDATDRLVAQSRQLALIPRPT